MKLVFEKSVPGRQGVEAAVNDVGVHADIKPSLLRERPAGLPELSELDVVRHYTELSRRNYGIDTGFYPLGSCTMKYNPKAAELVAHSRGFTDLHPLLPQLPTGETLVQGALAVLFEFDQLLRQICGMAAFTMQPLAGAHGELTGVMIMAAYHRDRGNNKKVILIPDSAHGTNPATAAMSGYTVENLKSNSAGMVDIASLVAQVNEDVAALMLTNPNTLGVFE